MPIDYSHDLNIHTREGGRAGFAFIASHVAAPVRSLIDVGCGTGVWLRAALDHGVSEVLGVDGIVATAQQLEVKPSLIQRCDLTTPVVIGRRFDVALCLEVAEHLDEKHGPQLIASLARLADTVVFSAACPGQPGQHHVNCQWPDYWQKLFNAEGFFCDDTIRWAMWAVSDIEPWYRQNIFVAKRCPDDAGREPRILRVHHPEMALQTTMLREQQLEHVQRIERGSMPMRWYFAAAMSALGAKIRRRVDGYLLPTASRAR